MLAPGGGDSRADTVRRYVAGFRVILARPESAILAVSHGLPIRYALNAARGEGPTPVVEQIEYAVPYRLTHDELERAVDMLEAWCAKPSWATSASP